MDASPLILLTKAGHLDLLRLGGADVAVPDVVAAEIGVRGPGDPTGRSLRLSNTILGRIPALPVQFGHGDQGEGTPETVGR